MKRAKDDLTPAQIVEKLDRYVVGQRDAKRAVAVAIRNRWRRLQLDDHMREEVVPKNILLMGPTGVGKTEIARRIATLMDAPFTKVEATKFTEVGYVGRDVESIIRDLVSNSVLVVQERARRKVGKQAREAAQRRVLDALVRAWRPGDQGIEMVVDQETGVTAEQREVLRRRLAEELARGRLDDHEVEVETRDDAQELGSVFNDAAFAQMGFNPADLVRHLRPKQAAATRTSRMPVREALETLTEEEAARLVDAQDVNAEAVRLVEDSGIVFLDEIDKVAGRTSGSGPDVSREGVQRDLLPLIEGTTVSTQQGPVKTDHILFIGAGAFHVSKPSDLLPELQGRMPIRVRLEALSEEDFVRILTEPRNALTKQYVALLATEGVKLSFTGDGVAEIARVSAHANRSHENIGARRLFTVMERVLDEVSFEGPALRGQALEVDRAYVRERVGDLLEDQDLGRFVL